MSQREKLISARHHARADPIATAGERVIRAGRTPRAARGANRQKALAVIADRPGLTVAELSSATGIAKGVVYSLARTLTQQGQIERVEVPGDTIGFRLARSADPVDGGSDLSSG